MPGRLRPIAVNVFNLVVIADPMSVGGMAAGIAAYEMYDK